MKATANPSTHDCGTATPVAPLLGVAEAYLRFAETQPSLYRFMFVNVIGAGGESVSAAQGDPDRDAFAYLRAALHAAIEQQAPAPELSDVDALARKLWAGMHVLISLCVVRAEEDRIPWADLRAAALQATHGMIHAVLREPITRRE